MKIYGILDSSRSEEELSQIVENMSSSLNHGFYSADNFINESLGLGRLYSEVTSPYTQPIWDEEESKFIFMIGNIFDYEKRKRELISRGHSFRYKKSDAEFVLHGIEEWGNELLKELNGVFVFALYDTKTQTLTIVNDRYGMKPYYYYYDESFFIFASEVKAIIRDSKVKKEINWDGWRDIFSYGNLLGTKTLFSNIYSSDNASILNINQNEISITKYWSYNQIKVDYESSEEYFIDEGARLIRQAIKRQTEGLEDCIVPLSGGYDSRCIAGAIKKYTNVNFETFTLFTSEEDVIFAKEIADCLNIKNIYIPRPKDLIRKYLIDMVFLYDGMRVLLPPAPVSLMMLHYVLTEPKICKVSFNGLAGDTLLKGERLERNNLRNITRALKDDYKLALILYEQMRRAEIYEFFYSPIREKLKPSFDSLLKEIKLTGKHRNRMTNFHIKNITKNIHSLCINNIISIKTPCFFPFLDNDLVEFSLSIPPMMKHIKKIYFKILKKNFPEVMKISSTNDPNFLHFFLPTFARSKSQKKKLFILLLKRLKYFLIHRRPRPQIEIAHEKARAEIGYMLNLLKTLEIPSFISHEKLLKKTLECLNKNKNTLNFIVPILIFCIWYNLFIDNIPYEKLITQAQSIEHDHARGITSPTWGCSRKVETKRGKFYG